MPQPILSDDTGGLRSPAVASPSGTFIIALLWLGFACALPLYQLQQARHQAHQDLLQILASEKPDAGSLLAVFDRSNRNLDAAAFGPCLIQAFTIIFLINQMLKLKRRYHALAHERPIPDSPPDALG